MTIKGYEPKDFNLSRMIRFTVTSTITLILIAFIFNVGIASAESGSIIISDDKVYDYIASPVITGYSTVFTTIYFDNSNYNYLSSFHFHPSGAIFVNEYESTSFSIVSGATGGTGYVNYDKNQSAVYYVFPVGMIVTGDTIIIQPANNIFANITAPYEGGNHVISSTKPVFLKCTHPTARPAGEMHSVSVSMRATDYYLVDYPIAEYFRLNITKNPYVATKYFVMGTTTTYSQETEFNKKDIVGAMFKYKDGIILNATLASGIYTKVWVNSTISEAYKTDLYYYNINYSKSSYSLGEQINFSYSITDNTVGGHFYFFDTKQTETGTGNFYVNSYDLNPQPGILIGTATGYIMPSAFTDMISTFEVCIVTGGTDVYCKSVPYGSVNESVVVTGNISIDKSAYNMSDIVTMNYNISTSGRIIIQRGLAHGGNVIFSQQAFSGTNKQAYYTINNVDSATYYIKLQYLKNGVWITLPTGTASYRTISQLNTISFDTTTINQGEIIGIGYTINATGRVILKDSSEAIKFNYTALYSGGYVDRQSYNVLFTDALGIWTAELINNEGGLLASTSIIVNSGVMPPIPTATAISTPSSLIDISNEISTNIFGEIGRDDNGRISEQGISDMGDKIFMTLLLFVFVIICLLVFTKKR